jgi:hypothetical protein
MLHWLRKVLGQPADASSETVATAWQRAYARQPGGMAVLLAPGFDRVEQLAKSALPALDVELDLELALMLKYVAREPQTCEALLDRALQIAQRVRIDGLCDARPQPASCHLQLERAETYVRWLKTGHLEKDRLLLACELALRSVRENSSDAYFAEGYALDAARIALVGEEPELALSALRSRKRWHHAAAIGMHDVLANVARLQGNKELEDPRVARDEFGALFDLYRHPHPDKASTELSGSKPVIRFELAVLMARLRLGRDAPVDPGRACELVVALDLP